MTLREQEGYIPVDGYRVPTLIISGIYDESTPVINEVLHRGIAGSEWVLLQNSSHLAHVEEPELYMQTVQAFLRRVESALQ